MYTVVFEADDSPLEQFSVTENLEPMWMAAGLDLYDIKGLEGHEVLPIAVRTLQNVEVSPEYYQLWAEAVGVTFGPSGYQDLLDFLEQLRDTCVDLPGARIDVWF